jgi:hypothetical protein
MQRNGTLWLETKGRVMEMHMDVSYKKNLLDGRKGRAFMRITIEGWLGYFLSLISFCDRIFWDREG